ncbi:sigma-70 family RNA polymerase sigma factor [Spirosoma sp. KCTC 42546]|uniref:RNA polymerase sigma factor n=1 Tax=Spirosoma sp. KCTC 42546 TaxID=2520506 RepID=UPI0011586DFE|nr:sigma-70 family RNA polymerase sigma factor [Spirosoma sp. KCTC 42546]QDK82677.1 sigma-70 family RNA polymerase sigma factor [Spirosoma sp. KCTC 42546]
MSTSLTDEALIRQYMPHQPNECFETLYNRYVNKVYRHCLSITKDTENAHDFTHDIFIKMFSKLDTFHERSSFSTWLYSITHNYCAGQLRLSKRLTLTTLDESEETCSSEGQDAQIQEQSLQLLKQAMASLSANEQTLLKLKYEQGMRFEEIAQLYNLKLSTVKMRIKRSRDKVYRLCSYQNLPL